jgi:hypothetical protein
VAAFFSLSKGRPAEGAIAAFLGIYLGYAVARLQEVFPKYAVPRLPFVLTLIFIGALAITIPPHGWRAVWQRSNAVRTVAFLLGLAVVTMPIGIWMMGSFEFLKDRFIITVIVYLSCAVFLRDRRHLRRAVAIYLLAVTAITAKSVFFPEPLSEGMLADIAEANERREAAGLEPVVSRLYVSLSLDPNDYGSILVSAIPLALWLGHGSFRRRLFWGAIALLLVGGVVPTASRASMLGLIAIGFALVLQAENTRTRAWMGVLAAGGAAVFLATVSQGQLGRFTDLGSDDYNFTSTSGRLSFWRQGMIWMIKRPTGLGIDNFPTMHDWVMGAERAAHNSFVQYGAELGVIGLAAFIYLWYWLLRGLRRHRVAALAYRRVDPVTGTTEAALASSAFALLIGTMITGFFLSNGYNTVLYMPLGIATAVLLGSPLEASPAPGLAASHVPSRRFARAPRPVPVPRRPTMPLLPAHSPMAQPGDLT